MEGGAALLIGEYRAHAGELMHFVEAVDDGYDGVGVSVHRPRGQPAAFISGAEHDHRRAPDAMFRGEALQHLMDHLALLEPYHEHSTGASLGEFQLNT
jgi:hypothetical protein